MSRVVVPAKDRFFELLRRLEGRVSAIERRNLSGLHVVTPAAAAPDGSAPGGFNGSYNVPSEWSHPTRSVNWLAVPSAPRVAWLVQARSNAASTTATFRLAIHNDDNPYTATLPSWQVLAEWTRASDQYAMFTGNVALPTQALDGRPWTFSIHGKCSPATGTEFWQVRPWALAFTSDPGFVPSFGYNEQPQG